MICIIVVVLLCVGGLSYLALRYGVHNTNDIETVKPYTLTDKVIRPYNTEFCQGLLAKLKEAPNNFHSNATLYLLNSPPLLTDHELFNLSKVANLNSKGTNFHDWNFYMNPGSEVSFNACYQQNQDSGHYATFYLIKGTRNLNKWTDKPGSNHAVKYSRLSADCQTISYKVTNFDSYFFVFYLEPGHSPVTMNIDFMFNRTVYHISLSDVVQNCSIPLNGDSSCSVSVPLSSRYTAVLSLNTSLPVDYDDGANISITCQARVWLYAVIILSIILALIGIIVIIVLCIVIVKRMKAKTGKESYSLLSESATTLQHDNTDGVNSDDVRDSTSVPLNTRKPGSIIYI